MKKGLVLLIICMIITACGKEKNNNKYFEPGDEILGSWVDRGTNYAGSQIVGSTEFIFNSDKTFVALDKAKGMPTISETGLWIVKGDTLKMKFKKSPKQRNNVIAYDERNGGSKDIIKPVPADSNGYIAWNYKVNGNKLIITNPNNGYTGPCELEKN